MSESVTRLNQGQAPIAGPSQPQPAANGPGALNAALPNARTVAAHTPARVAAGPTRQATQDTVASSLRGLVSGNYKRSAQSKASDIMQILPEHARSQGGLNNIARAIDERRNDVDDLLHLNHSDADAGTRMEIRAALLMLLAEGRGVERALDSKDAIVGREIAEHNAATALQRCLDRFDFSSKVSTKGAMEIIRELPAGARTEFGLKNISNAVASDADGVKELLNFNGGNGTPQQLLRVRAELVAMLAQGKDLSALQARKQELSAFMGFVTELKSLVSGRSDKNAKVDDIIKRLPAEAMAGQGLATISDAIAKDRRRVDALLHFPNKGSDAYRLDARVNLLARLANGDGLDEAEKVKEQFLTYLNLLETLTSLVSGHRGGVTAELKAKKIMSDLVARGVRSEGFEKISAAIANDRRRVDDLLHFKSYQGADAGERVEVRVGLLMEIANGRSLDETEKVKKTLTAEIDLVEDLTTILSGHGNNFSARQEATQITEALLDLGVDNEGMEKIRAAIAPNRRRVDALLHFRSHQGSDDDRVLARAELLQVFAQNGGWGDATRRKARMLGSAGVNDVIHLANRPAANVVRVSAVGLAELDDSTSANPARPIAVEIPPEHGEAVLKHALGIEDDFPLSSRATTGQDTIYRTFSPEQLERVALPGCPATGTDHLVTSGKVLSLPVVVFWKAHGGQQMATLFHLGSIPSLEEFMSSVSSRAIASVDSISFVGRRNDTRQDRSGAVEDRLTQISHLTGIPVQIIETQVFSPKVTVDVQGARILIMEEDPL